MSNKVKELYMDVVEGISKQRYFCVMETLKTELVIHLPHLTYFLPYFDRPSLIGLYNLSVPVGPFACKLDVLGDPSGRIIKPVAGISFQNQTLKAAECRIVSSTALYAAGHTNTDPVHTRCTVNVVSAEVKLRQFRTLACI